MENSFLFWFLVGAGIGMILGVCVGFIIANTIWPNTNDFDYEDDELEYEPKYKREGAPGHYGKGL